jgi:hypothetical protein
MAFDTENPQRRSTIADMPQHAATVTRRFHYLPLSGLLFAVLVVIGGPVLEGSTPDSSASGTAVISYYASHHAQERAGAAVLTLAFALLLVFAASLRTFWKQVADREGLATLALAGAAVLTTGQTIGAGINYTLADDPVRLTPGAAQALNVLGNDLVLTSAAGVVVFAITAGALIVRSKGQLPAWLGWLSIVAGIVIVVPGGDLFGFILILLWSAIVGVLVSRTTGRPAFG